MYKVVSSTHHNQGCCKEFSSVILSLTSFNAISLYNRANETRQSLWYDIWFRMNHHLLRQGPALLMCYLNYALSYHIIHVLPCLCWSRHCLSTGLTTSNAEFDSYLHQRRHGFSCNIRYRARNNLTSKNRPKLFLKL